MKKAILILAVILLMESCSNGINTTAKTDSTKVDTITNVVDSTVNVVDTIK